MPFQDHLKEISRLQRGIEKMFRYCYGFGVSRAAADVTLNVKRYHLLIFFLAYYANLFPSSSSSAFANWFGAAGIRISIKTCTLKLKADGHRLAEQKINICRKRIADCFSSSSALMSLRVYTESRLRYNFLPLLLPHSRLCHCWFNITTKTCLKCFCDELVWWFAAFVQFAPRKQNSIWIKYRSHKFRFIFIAFGCDASGRLALLSAKDTNEIYDYDYEGLITNSIKVLFTKLPSSFRRPHAKRPLVTFPFRLLANACRLTVDMQKQVDVLQRSQTIFCFSVHKLTQLNWIHEFRLNIQIYSHAHESAVAVWPTIAQQEVSLCLQKAARVGR